MLPVSSWDQYILEPAEATSRCKNPDRTAPRAYGSRAGMASTRSARLLYPRIAAELVALPRFSAPCQQTSSSPADDSGFLPTTTVLLVASWVDRQTLAFEIAVDLPAMYQSAIAQAKTLPRGKAISYHRGSHR